MTVTTSVETSTSLSGSGAAGGAVIVGGVTASATLTLYSSADGLTFAPLHDVGGAAATLVVPAEGGIVALPDAAYSARWLKLVSTTDMGTAAAVTVTFKS